MPRSKKKVLIVGTGTIGAPLIKLLSSQKEKIGLGDVIFHKRTPLRYEKGKIKKMLEAGAKLATDTDKLGEFLKLGFPAAYTWEGAIEAADVIIDCTPEGNNLKEKYYHPLSLRSPEKGFIAQGSEEGFGKPYAWTINDHALSPGRDRFIQVVSCNTHQVLCILKSLTLHPAGFLNLQFGNFTIVRRGSDVSENKGTPGIEAEKSSHKPYGSHQVYDAARVLSTIFPDKLTFRISGQVLKAPTQYMHAFMFHLHLNSPITQEDAISKLRNNPLVAFTHINSTNKVVGHARDFSDIMGRILNQTVFFEPSLFVSEDGTRISGTCFTPQDGNALLSSVAATLWLLDPKTYREKMKVFDKFLFDEI